MEAAGRGAFLWLDEWITLDSADDGQEWFLPPERYLNIGAARYMRVSYEVTAVTDGFMLKFESANTPEPNVLLGTTSPRVANKTLVATTDPYPRHECRFLHGVVQRHAAAAVECPRLREEHVGHQRHSRPAAHLRVVHRVM